MAHWIAPPLIVIYPNLPLAGGLPAGIEVGIQEIEVGVKRVHTVRVPLGGVGVGVERVQTERVGKVLLEAGVDVGVERVQTERVGNDVLFLGGEDV